MSKTCVAEDVNGTTCGLPADKKFGVAWMCKKHRSSLYNFVRMNTRDKLVAYMEDNNCISRHTFGITYFIKLPNGNVKIGYVLSAANLCKRMQVLPQEYGGNVYLLATVYGGESMEALMHHRFKDARITWTHNEQFRYTAELEDFCTVTGHVNAGKQAITMLRRKLSFAK